MENNINIKNIIQKIALLLKCKNIEILSVTTFKKYTSEYILPSIFDDRHKNIHEKLKYIYWAVVDTQIEIGYMLIYLDSCDKFQYSNDMENYELSHCFFVHHYSLASECIYRVWERVSRVLDFINTKKLNIICYYHKIIHNIKVSNEYPNTLIDELESHLQEWEKVKYSRNKYSHEYSKLTHGINFEVRRSILVDEYGENMWFSTETRDHNEMLNEIITHYNYLKFLDKTLVKFIDSFR